MICLALMITQIIIDSIAALARKEALNERDKEAYFINQVGFNVCALCLIDLFANNSLLF